MILIIDNYDSFTYNLYQYIGELVEGEEILVKYNDVITCQEIETLKPRCIVLSPGPKYPKDAGICIEVIKTFSGKIPLLGICLGHQAIGEAFGGNIVPASTIVHGKASPIKVNREHLLFKGLGEEIEVGRYHSLMIERATLPEELEIVGEDEEGEIMAVSHKLHATYGMQFHPESILTPKGKQMLKQFLEVKL